jgi:RNA polymerase sigma factor (sigma-70 family)
MFNSVLCSLPQRHHIIDKFCQYIRVDNYQGRIMFRWENEVRLRRNFELYQRKHEKFAFLSQSDSPNEKELVQFWINLVLNEQSEQEEWEPVNRVQFALEHLYSYCEESCYYATRQVCQQNSSFNWENYFFIGRSFLYSASQFQSVLRKYDSSQSSLNTYIQQVLFNHIKDQASVGKFSKWKLLCNESEKKSKEALGQAGISSAKTSCILFVRKYFIKVYKMNKVHNPIYKKQKKWPEPDEQDFVEAAQIYNGEKSLPSTPHEVYASAEITAEQLQNLMEICINALINYSHRSNFLQSCTSLETSPEIRNQIQPAEEVTESLFKEVKISLQEKLYSFREDQKEVILFYYGLKWKQKKIAAQYKVNQTAISKRLTTIEKNLLQVIVQFKKPSTWVTLYINQWLKKSYVSPNYSDLLEVALVEALKTLPEEEQQILRLHYGEARVEQAEMMSRFHLTATEFLERVRKIEISLNQAVLKKIENWRKKLVETWLENYSHQTIHSACQNLQICIELNEEIPPEIINAILKKCLEIWHS